MHCLHPVEPASGAVVPHSARDCRAARVAAQLGVPFLKTYRPIYLAPKPEFRRVLEGSRERRLAA